MTTSTTMVYGTNAHIEALTGTTVHDLSGSTNKVTIALEMIIGEANVLQDKWPQRVMTAKNATVDVAAWYSTASNEVTDYFMDWFNEANPAVKTIRIYPSGKTSGHMMISASWVFNGLNIDVQAAQTNPTPVTFQLLNAGTVTISAYTT